MISGFNNVKRLPPVLAIYFIQNKYIFKISPKEKNLNAEENSTALILKLLIFVPVC